MGEAGVSVGHGTAKLPVEETGVPRRMCVVDWNCFMNHYCVYRVGEGCRSRVFTCVLNTFLQ